jgi:FtsP/CotA-like multicopper oxidase with cupredoxin domain
MAVKRTFRAASLLAALSVLGFATAASAARVEYELVVAEGEVNVTGRPVSALTLNGGIPGPVLRFSEGDLARISVRNDLGEETSIHWHGLLVPPGMDGVPWVSFPPIAPGATFTYEFPIRQSGTYWYHSHSGLQEQRGVYGAVVITPAGGGAGVDRDEAVVLSDWTDEDPARVLHTLKRGGHWYATAKGSAQSLVGAAKIGMLGDFFATQLQRMPPMDIADVAYDRFLANGRPETTLPAEGLDVVRLRVVNGSATTYFHLEFAGGPVTIVAADGQQVEPVSERRLLIGVAETYDLVFMVPPDGRWELRATAHDGSAHASVWLGAGELHPAPAVPRPNIYRAMAGPGLAEIFALTPGGAMGMPDDKVRDGAFDRPGMMHAHGGPGEGVHAGHGVEAGRAGHAGHGGDAAGEDQDGRDGPGAAATSPVAAAAASEAGHEGRRGERDFSLLGTDAASAPLLAEEGGAERPWPPYGRLRSPRSTALPPGRPVREVRLTLDGDMERYVWFLNGRALWEDDTIPVRAGEAVRFIMINRTMMHHPMHLHGHFFRVVNGQGDRAPLKHTVDVAPMSTTVIEFAADELGDWLFHCHLLYHMESGMARVVRYEGYAPGPELAGRGAMVHEDHWHGFATVDLLSSMTVGELRLADTRDELSLRWEAGWGGGDDAWETLAAYARAVNAFFSPFAGIEAAGDEGAATEARGVLGVRYLLPLVIEAAVRADTRGELRVTLEKELPLLPRLQARGEIEYDTGEGWEGKAGLSYALGRDLCLLAEWHSEFGWGAGMQLRH